VEKLTSAKENMAEALELGFYPRYTKHGGKINVVLGRSIGINGERALYRAVPPLLLLQLQPGPDR